MSANLSYDKWHLNGYAYNRDDATPSGRRVMLVGPDSDLCEGWTVNSANHEICRISSHRRKADANLIAAAPELLQACELLLKTAGLNLAEQLPGDVQAIERAQAAIAKARGIVSPLS